MAKVKLPENIQSAIDKFFDSSVKVYEAGSEESRPDSITDRPFFNVLPKEKTSYFQKTKDKNEGKDPYIVSQENPIKDTTLSTQNSKLVQSLEKRFRKVRPNMTLFVIDQDLVRGRYIMDESPDRSLEKSVFDFVEEKISKEDTKKAHTLEPGDEEDFIEAAFEKSEAFSETLPLGVTETNLKGNRAVSIIVGDNPDKLEDEMFAEVPGALKRMEQEEITPTDLKKFTFYHEFGHALDLAHSEGYLEEITNTDVQNQMARHKAECFADAHAVLQLARDNGDTKAGRLISDVRVDTVRKNIERADPNNKKLSGLVAKIAKIRKEKLSPRKETEDASSLRNYEKTSKDFKMIDKIGRVGAYHTTPVADAAVEFAEKGLKDGSLLKMTDLEVLEASKKLVEDNAFTSQQMNSFRLAVFKGEKTSDVLGIISRSEEARDRMVISKKEQNKMYAKQDLKLMKKLEVELKKELGIPVVELKDKKGDNKEEMEQELGLWEGKLIEQVSREGGDRKALLKVIVAEQDSIRKKGKKDKLGDAKLQTINEFIMPEADEIVATCGALRVVSRSIEAVKLETPVASGEKAVSEFIGNELSKYELAEQALDKASGRDMTMMTVEENEQVLKEEGQVYKKIIQAEKKAQMLAFEIRKDTKAWGIINDVPELADLVIEKAKRKHPEWLDTYHFNFVNNDNEKVCAIMEGVEMERFALEDDVLSSKKINKSIRKNAPDMLKQIENNTKAPNGSDVNLIETMSKMSKNGR